MDSLRQEIYSRIRPVSIQCPDANHTIAPFKTCDCCGGENPVDYENYSHTYVNIFDYMRKNQHLFGEDLDYSDPRKELINDFQYETVDCPECESIGDDQYQCMTCGCAGAQGKLSVYDYLNENRYFFNYDPKDDNNE